MIAEREDIENSDEYKNFTKKQALKEDEKKRKKELIDKKITSKNKLVAEIDEKEENLRNTKRELKDIQNKLEIFESNKKIKQEQFRTKENYLSAAYKYI